MIVFQADYWYGVGAKKGAFLSQQQRSLYNADRPIKAKPWWSSQDFDKSMKDAVAVNFQTFQNFLCLAALKEFSKISVIRFISNTIMTFSLFLSVRVLFSLFSIFSRKVEYYQHLKSMSEPFVQLNSQSTWYL